MKVRLTSKCNVKGCEGMPGDVVEFKDKRLALGKRIIASKGGVEVKAEEESPSTEDDLKKD